MNNNEAKRRIKLNSLNDSVQGLAAIRTILNETGNPEKKYKIIHVAGTNGKGSICTFLSSMLMKAGYKVGLYTSPSMIHYNDRIKVNNENISDQDLTGIADRLKEQFKDRGLEPNEFEWITAIGFQYFAQEHCDIVILEVGLGGRLDATNVIEKPLISLISTIGFDHQELLGNTLGEIAGEKAGIIKEGVPVVLYPGQSDEVNDVVKAKAKAVHTTLSFAEMDKDKIISVTPTEQIFTYKSLGEIKMTVLGVHQFYNAAMAIEALLILRDKGQISISDEEIKSGMLESRFPGRFETLLSHPVMIADGAHNEQAVGNLAKNLETYYPDKKVVAIFGVLAHKFSADTLKLIDNRISHYYLVEPNSERKLSIEETKKLITQHSKKPIEVLESLKETIDDAINTIKDNEIIVCFGSLYLVSDVMKEMYGRGL